MLTNNPVWRLPEKRRSLSNYRTPQYESSYQSTPPSAIVPIFLGRGGSKPAVCMLDAFTADYLGHHSLTVGETPYAIAYDFKQRVILAGTKQGTLHVGLGLEGIEDIKAWRWRTTSTTDPVLCVVKADDSSFMSGHITGHALRWAFDQEKLTSETIMEQDPPIITLTVARNGVMWGLTEDGTIISTRGASHDVLSFPAIPPCGILSLNQLCRWGAHDTFAYAGQSGRLVLVHPETTAIESVPSHHGSFILIGMVLSNFITIGTEDGECLLWETDNPQTPLHRLTAPQGIISGCPLAGTEPRMLLVKKDGTAGIYELRKQELSKISTIEGQDYRVAVAPDATAVAQAIDQYRNDEANQILDRIQQSVGRAQEIELAQSYQRLEELGRGNDVLRLRAGSPDTAESLAACHELAQYQLVSEQTLPDYSLYLELLEKTAQWRDAVVVAESMLAIRPDAISVKQQNRLRNISNILKSDCPLLVVPEIPIDKLIASSDRLSKPCQGRFILKEFPAISCTGNTITAECFVLKCQEIVHETHPNMGVQITTINCWWLRGLDPTEITTILFYPSDEAEMCGILLAGQLHADNTAMEIAIAAVFDASSWPLESDVKTHNQMLQKVLDRLRNSARIDSWVRFVLHLLRAATIQIQNASTTDTYGKI